MASPSGTPIRCTCDVYGRDQGPLDEARADVDGVSAVEDLIASLPSAARLPEELQRNLPSLRGDFSPPLNDVQKYSVLLGLVPRDVLCDAPDGLGQVASFLLPMLVALIRSLPSGLRPAAGRCQCVPDTLILCATRQMCDEVAGVAKQLLQGTGVRCGRFGEAVLEREDANPWWPWQPPSDTLLLVATVAELKFERSVDLSQTFGLVLYGLGMMYDMGLADDLQHLLAELPGKDVRQTMIFGQLQRKRDVLKQAEEMLYSPMKISVNTCDRQVQHTWEYLPRAGKMERLSQLVSDWQLQGDGSSRILVIAHSSCQARAVDEHLRGTCAAAVVWKETEEEARLSAVCPENWRRFCCGEVQVISGSEAGVHDKDISYVRMIINFDPPQKARNVRNRFGKGLQRLNPRTEIVTFVTPENCRDPEAFDAQALESMRSALGGEVPYQIERDTRAAAEGAEQEAAWAHGEDWVQPAWQERTWNHPGGPSWNAPRWDTAQRRASGYPVPSGGPVLLGRLPHNAQSSVIVTDGPSLPNSTMAVCTAGGDAPQPQTLTKAFSVKTGFFCVHWTVDGGKLWGNEKHAVSPHFELSFGPKYPAVTFMMMIYPEVVKEGKGQCCFRKSKGRGYVQIKCGAELEESIAWVSFRISIGSGNRTVGPRGPCYHNFSQSAVAGLEEGPTKDEHIWDFTEVLDEASQTFVVCLEIVPSGKGPPGK